MQPVLLLNVVGLTASLLPHAPRIQAFATQAGQRNLLPPFPAVTTTCQSSMLTGLDPADHGIVANGWYDRETAEIRFWQRSAHLVQGETVWDAARDRDPAFTCANLFGWYNTYASCETVVQVRPQYHANGRKVPDLYTQPADFRDTLQAPSPQGLGTFPLFNFWGPGADLTSTQWIAHAAARTLRDRPATLTLVYLPHLDYPLQRLGPDHPDIPREVAALDTLVGELLDLAQAQGIRPLVVSEYAIEPVVPGDGAIAINRTLREAGLLNIRVENGRELLEPGASAAFAVADHQVAHIYHDPAIDLPDIPHTQRVTLRHPRAGDTVLEAQPGRWFTYDYWPAHRPDLAPDFARTVDIHRKPGYDPRELFLGVNKAAVARKLMLRKLGFRNLLDVVPLDTALVRGTHGRTPREADAFPLLIGAGSWDTPLPMRDTKSRLLQSIFD